MRWRCALALAVVLVVADLPTHPVWAIRPLFTEDPATVGAGKVELELGADYAKEDGKKGGPSGKLTIGIQPWLDIAYETGLLVVAPAEKCVRAGMNDSTLMLKAAWPGAASRPALGAVVNVRLPAGDPGREIGEPGTDVLARGIIGQTFGPVTVFANAGYTFVTDDRRLDRWFLSAAATGSATDRVLVMGEVISELGVSRADDEVLGRLGLAYAFTERVRGDLGVGVGLNRPAPEVVVTVGVTIAF